MNSGLQLGTAGLPSVLYFPPVSAGGGVQSPWTQLLSTAFIHLTTPVSQKARSTTNKSQVGPVIASEQNLQFVGSWTSM